MIRPARAIEPCFACGKPVGADPDGDLFLDRDLDRVLDRLLDRDRDRDEDTDSGSDSDGDRDGAGTGGREVVLVLGRHRRTFCSESCLRRTLQRQRTARAARLRWWSLRLAAVVLLLVTSRTLWRRHRAPPREWISFGLAEEPLREAEPPPGPILFGPNWPPSDADWAGAFTRASWVYPLPGPVRRACSPDGRLYGPPSPREQPAFCRRKGRCGVDLGGDLWGEHVYAALDGVVDRVQRNGNDEPGGQYVRLSHFGGMVFTQYFHLAATPRGLVAGARVKGGDVIGLMGDTGSDCLRRHLHFTLSVRPSKKFTEVYWDPQPWMEGWPLRVPPHGSVAGLASLEKKGESTPRRGRPR